MLGECTEPSFPRPVVYAVRSILIDERLQCGETPDSQTAEIQFRVALINRFNALGTAEIVCVA